MKKIILALTLFFCISTVYAKTLIVYYSFTGNCKAIATELQSQIDADILQVYPAEDGLDYAANNYELGSQLISAIRNNPDSQSSYPDVLDVDMDISQYSTYIIITPLWWSQMSAIMQSFLFRNAACFAGKNVGLIVSSYSSGISGVESDAKRLLPKANFMSESLWINNSKFSQRKTLIAEWLKNVDYENISKKQTSNTMNITVNSHVLTVDLVDNSSTEALLELLKEGPITYEAHDYGNFEKVGNIGHTLPQNNEDITTEPGDVILYLGTNICIYYDTNEWDFTRLGKIRDVSQDELKKILGTGNVTVTLSLDGATSIKTVISKESLSSGLYDLKGRQIKDAKSKETYIENGIKKMK